MRIRTRLFCTCAVVLVMGTVAAIKPADAQGGFLGNVTSSMGFGGGNPTFQRSGTGDIVEVRSEQTIIDWRPDDQTGTGTIDFLPAANNVIFQNGISTTFGNFTVLNRIQPIDGTTQANTSRIVALNGSISSNLNGNRAGSVWFYTPGGIVVGSTGVFDVGSLLLTTNNIDISDGLFDQNGSIRIRGDAGNTAGVTINSGARINATATNSYVALVAPRVTQGGTVTVNGSTAYIAAEQADIRINGGLFDIAITAGSTDGNGVVHTGTTTGPASTASTDRQNIYMVAVPKNNAVTMLLSGNIGYPTAATAAQEGSGVVLSAGYGVGYDTDNKLILTRPSTATGTAGLNITTQSLTSALSLNATDDIAIAPTGALQFSTNTTITTGNSISLTANTGVTIGVAGDLTLNAGSGTNGGSVSLTTNGAAVAPTGQGRINVTGALNINTVGSGVSGQPDAIGGPVSLTSNWGRIDAGTLDIQTTGNAANDLPRSGNAVGGNVSLSVANGGQMNFTTTTIEASGNAIYDDQTLPVDGGNATGGTIRFLSTGGSLNLGEVNAKAQATGGSATSGTVGSATSGNIIVDLSSGTHDWTFFLGDVSTATGFSTLGQGTAGSAIPDTTGIKVDVSGSATLNIAQSVSLYGNAASYGSNDIAGLTRAAPVTVQARDGGTLRITRDLTIGSVAFANNNAFTPGNVTNEVRAGSVLIGALGGTFSAAGITVNVSAEAASRQINGGSAFGGSATLASGNSNGIRGDFSLTDCINFDCSVIANATGAGGTSNGTGGTISAYTSDADMTISGLALSAQGVGGSSEQLPSTGFGGTISIESRRGTSNNGVLSIGNLFASASASPQLAGGSNNLSDSDASGGTAGAINVILDGGTFTSDSVSLSANGTGASAAATFDGGPAYQAGTGTGGIVSLQLNGANATIGSLTIEANGTGGAAQGSFSPDSVAAIAGAGRGGSASLTATAGTLTVGNLAITANGTGGQGIQMFDASGAAGGLGIGGTAQFIMDTGSSATVDVNTLTRSTLEVSALGIGGAGGTVDVSQFPDAYAAGAGGTGTGGNASVSLAGGTLNVPLLTVRSTGIGGDGGRNGTDGAGGNAGSGIGGATQLTFGNEGHILGVVSLEARGSGGVAGDAKAITGYDINDDPIYTFGIGAGGAGGLGTGGLARMQIDVDPVIANLTIDAGGAGTAGGTGATGGNGGAGNGGTNGLGAQLAVNFGSLTVTDLLNITAEGFGGEGGNGTTGIGGNGGIGTGGESGLIAMGGSTQVQTYRLQILSAGLGGDGGESGTQGGGGLNGGSGGAAFGGTAGLLVADNAQFTFDLSTQIGAGAVGGTGRVATPGIVGGDGGSGGNATGGIARLSVQNATLIDSADGSVEILAGALAGVGGFGADIGGLGGRGGDATGGLAQFEGASGSIDLNRVTIEATANGGATAYGPLGNAGGDAQGGTARADFFNFVGTALPAPGTSNFASLTLSADASGGTGGGGANGRGGTGGNAIGGTAAATVDGAGIVARFDTFAAAARALGGNAGTALDAGVAGAAGGSATGGRARFDATGNSETTLGLSATILADATGGAGGTGSDGTLGSNGGAGGAALGGDARFTINAAQVLNGGGNNYVVSAEASGGAGGIGGNGSNTGASGGLGGNGGDSTGGLALFSATTGNFDLPNLSILANGTGGLGGTGGFGPASSGNPSATPPIPPSAPIQSAIGISGGGAGGIAQLLNSDTGGPASIGQHNISSVTLQANGIFPSGSAIGFAPTAGRVDISDTSSANNGGLVVNGVLTAEAFGDGACACSGIVVKSSVNPIRTGDSFLSTDGSISFDFASSGSFRASGALLASSGSTITITQGSRGAIPVDSLFANTLTLSAPGDIVTNGLTVLRSADAMDITSQNGTVQLAQLFSGGTMNVTALASSVRIDRATAGGLLQLSAASGTEGGTVSGGRVVISGDRGISFDGIASQGTTTLTATNGAIQTSNLASLDVILATAQAINLTGTGTLNFASALATSGNLNLSAGTLDVATGSASNDVVLTSTAGALNASALSGASITATSAGDASFGTTSSASSLRITARGTASFAGQAAAPTIQVTSGDIVIGSGARLGLQGTTQSLTIGAFSGQGRTYIGGGDQAGAYSLSGDEMTRLFAQNILISPQGQTTVGGVTLTSGTTGNLGPNGLLTINSGGRMEVGGAVQLTGLSAQGGLTLRSSNGIDVFTDTGSIDLRGSGNALGGVLTLEGASVGVGTRSALGDIAGTTVSLDARNSRLARNDGAVNDEGFLRAGSINLDVVQGAYIQNSGAGTALADRRGFTANSFAIRTEGAGTEIVVNGRLVDSTGSFATGVETIPLASINGVAGGQVGAYADRSTINGCLIGNVVSCTVVIEEITPIIPSDDRDAIDRILDPTVTARQIFPVAIVELRDFVAEGYPPLIDEPVTGAGNEDLWDSDCSVSGDEGCDNSVVE